MRAALYARFSSDLQNPKSIRDQLADCRRYAERIGVTEVVEYQDEAISGAALANRAGIETLLQDVRAGAFDLVITEEISRLTRDGGHSWDIYGELDLLGIPLHTVAQGRAVDEVDIGLRGTFAALERKQTAGRVRRSQRGLIGEGRAIGSPPYGYRIRREYDAAGEPIRGLREIDPLQAAVVRRIFTEYLAGSSPAAIAGRLNAEGVPSPAGRAWSANTISGDARRPGILRNQIYVGVLTWGRRTWKKDRRTGKAKSRPANPEDLVRRDVPELRILDDDTFSAAQARLAELAAIAAAAGNASAANSPRRLLSGLVRCGCCGSVMGTSGRDHRYRCKGRRERGPVTCNMDRSPPADAVEAEALAQLRRDLLHPEVVEDSVRELRRLLDEKARARGSRKAALAGELQEVTRKLERLVDQVAEGVLSGRTVSEKIAQLEARQNALQGELAKLEACRGGDVVQLHPNLPARYRALVEDLQARLTAAESRNPVEVDAARQAIRRVIRAVRVIRGERRGEWSVELDADLTGLLQAAGGPSAPARRAAGGE